MKQLLSLFLFLLPCLAWAQYPSNGNQKITLGEQTTADGLIWRGVAADTTLTAKSDTAAYFVLDTVNINLYTYKASATGRKWRQLGADTAAIAYVNTYGPQTVNGVKTFTTAPTFSTALGVASGGTGATSFSPNNYLIRTNSSGIFDTSAIYEAGGNVGIGTTSPSYLVTSSSSNGNAFMYSAESNNISTVGNWVGYLYGYKGNTYQKGATIFESTDANGRGKFHIALNNANSPSNVSISDAKLTVLSNGNVGIGTASAAELLHVNGNVLLSTGYRIFGNSNTGTTSSFISLYNTTDGGIDLMANFTASKITFGTAGSERMRITSTGNVGIGTGTPQSGYRLHVVDSVYVGGNVSASAYTTRSDFNLKDDIFDLKYGLNDVLKLQPVEYIYKSNGSKQLGFIAQDIGTILPEVVSFEESMSVNYQGIIPILTKAIQEQQDLIKALEQRIINLENK
jgi:hypothetical protein